MKRKPLVYRAVLGLVAAFLLIQLVPYGHSYSNPPVVREPPWDSLETRALAKGACFDCHSNETEWPAYARVAPASWVIQRDVVVGRAVLNFSEWQKPQKEAHEAAEKLAEGEMPLFAYTLMHANARLTDAQRTRLVSGLERTLARVERVEEHDRPGRR